MSQQEELPEQELVEDGSSIKVEIIKDQSLLYEDVRLLDLASISDDTFRGFLRKEEVFRNMPEAEFEKYVAKIQNLGFWRDFIKKISKDPPPFELEIVKKDKKTTEMVPFNLYLQHFCRHYSGECAKLKSTRSLGI